MSAKVLNYLLLIIIFISVFLIKAPLTWGFSVTKTTAYLENSKKLLLWKDPKWLLLGHYEKTFYGQKSSFRGPLFIHSEGYNSPENELLATVNALFSPSIELTVKYKRHPQCQFLARRKWLIQKLNVDPNDILPCEERELWKKQLNATSVSLIFAASDLGNPASSFGHTFLKLISPANAENKDLLNYGVNYAADGDESEGFFYAFKGLLGMYNGQFTMLPYHQKIREYLNIEGRDIWEYKLAYTAMEVDELIDHLLELDGSTSPYYFISNNCSYQILVALDVIRPNLQLSRNYTSWVIPVDTVKTISRNSNLIVKKNHKQSLKADYLKSYSRLSSLQKKLLAVVIENLNLPVHSELQNSEKAQVYETAMKYLAVKSYQMQKDLDSEKYKLSLARAALGPVTTEVPSAELNSPEQSHDSSGLYFGYGKNAISDFTLVKFRINFHDIEQNDSGTIPFSQNTLGAFEVRYYSEIKKLSLDRTTLLNLINTNPVNTLDKNYSWKIRMEILDQLRPDVEVGGGLSFDSTLFRLSRVVYFITARYYKGQNHTYQFGPEILFLARPIDSLGFSAGLAYFGVYKTTPYLRFLSKINYEIVPNFDLQIQLNDEKEYQLSLLKNFIF